MLNIVIDENISYAEEAFSQFGNVSVVHGRNINTQLLKDTDVLIVRSITKVNEELLKGTRVKFVGTATIGTDHINLDYLKSKGIGFSDAKGCNADAVTEYVFTSIIKLLNSKKLPLKGRTIGIVGTGNIGSRVARIAGIMGMQVLKNDPPLQRESRAEEFIPLSDIYKCDIITFHVPLNKTGIDKTIHLLDQDNLNKLNENAILINASRGPVVDNNALIKAIDDKNLNVVLDVWESEPDIDIELLNRVKFGTPHIAGYSLEGKVNGTLIIYKALCHFLGEQAIWNPSLPSVESPGIIPEQAAGNEEILENIINSIYNIKIDDNGMRKLNSLPKEQISSYFDTLRKEYPLRREFSNYKISLDKSDEELTNILKALRFEITN
jgi:erythronate-4-phosphate dehydrogenase